ncbi:hypothetical protein D9758_006572 [Tetrapyrgos nigripes]|uniref:Uncharacterized protein n=1 Tax=Tetrapyrgos nigripes TaxID=182062 RepID=A0A8H5GKS4_9AGAR|nr:hypothetical protein D9758_006572 [Tetrapyrgos nigripes]
MASSSSQIQSSYTLQQILPNTTFHADLQQTAKELRDSPAQIKEQERLLKDLQTSLNQVKKKVADRVETTKKMRKEHEGLRDSTMKKLAHKMIGKEMSWNMKKDMEDSEAIQLKAKLEEQRDRLNLIQGEIEYLYERIFNDAGELFPRDTQLQNLLKAAQSAHDNNKSRVTSNSKAVPLLAQADRTIQESLGWAAYENYHGFNNGKGERKKKLKKAAKRAKTFAELFRQAQRACSEVQSTIPVLPIDAMHKTSHYFDSPLLRLPNGVDLDADLEKYRSLLMKAKNSVIPTSIFKGSFGTSIRQGYEAKEVVANCKELLMFRKATFESVVMNPADLLDPNDSTPHFESTADSPGLISATLVPFVRDSRDNDAAVLPPYSATAAAADVEALPAYRSLPVR